MGAWGTGISSNDTYCDVYEHFFAMYNEGMEVDEITEKLTVLFDETLRCDQDYTNYWFALARAQWECKALSPEVHEKVRTIIDTEDDLRIWAELDASEKDLKARRKVLSRFLETLAGEKEQPKKRKKIRFKPAIFEKGDCIVFQLSSGNYGGAFVVERMDWQQTGLNLILKTRINQADKPTLHDFASAEVLVRAITDYEDGAAVTKDRVDEQWFTPDGFKPCAGLFEVIGTIEPSKPLERKSMTIALGWEQLIRETEDYISIDHSIEQDGGGPRQPIRLVDYIRG